MIGIDQLELYKKILISVDNSQYSQYAEDVGVLLAKTCASQVTGLHVYSGQFHRMRFEALETHLPDKYQKKDILEYQEKIHSVLIERGLEIISSEYMKNLRDLCKNYGVSLEEKLLDGKNSDVIIDQSRSSDLTIIGSQGLGAVTGLSGFGSNAERVLRHTKNDVMIMRKKCDFRKIMVGVDGSDNSYMALNRAVQLAKLFNSNITILTSFDPQLHPIVFKSLASVLSDEAGKIFKFKEQEQLHNSVIDTSLEQLYQGYLEKGKKIAETQDIIPKTELLRGKPYFSIYNKLIQDDADLLVVGRMGMHKGNYEIIGSNTERLARITPTNILVIGPNTEKNSIHPEIKTSQNVPLENKKIIWNDDAQQRLERIPSFARPIAILAIERYAKENKINTITPEVMKNARDRYET